MEARLAAAAAGMFATVMVVGFLLTGGAVRVELGSFVFNTNALVALLWLAPVLALAALALAWARGRQLVPWRSSPPAG
ncbi:MAG: hypothetical protein ACRDH5_01635, partial [bacterium]